MLQISACYPHVNIQVLEFDSNYGQQGRNQELHEERTVEDTIVAREKTFWAKAPEINTAGTNTCSKGERSQAPSGLAVVV